MKIIFCSGFDRGMDFSIETTQTATENTDDTANTESTTNNDDDPDKVDLSSTTLNLASVLNSG